MDDLHLEHPFAGARMLRDMLRRKGHPVSRKRIGRLMKMPRLKRKIEAAPGTAMFVRRPKSRPFIANVSRPWRK